MWKYKTLILIDACDFGKDWNMKYVFSLPCDLIVTTRVNPVLWGYEDGILMGSLQETEWDIFFHSYLKEDYEKYSAIIQKQMDYSKGHLTWMMFTLRGIKEIQKKKYKSEEAWFHLQQEFQEFEKGILSPALLVPVNPMLPTICWTGF